MMTLVFEKPVSCSLGFPFVLALMLIVIKSAEARAEESPTLPAEVESGTPAHQTINEDSDAQGRSQDRFERGLEEAEAGRHGEAADLFAQSYALFPHSGTLMNLALYQQESGQLVEAARSWDLLLDRFGGEISPEARSRAEEHRAQLAASLATLTIMTRPEGATVTLDDERLGTTPLESAYRALPGRISIEANLEGYQPERSTIEVEGGDSLTVELTLSPEVVENELTTSPSSDIQPEARTTAWVGSHQDEGTPEPRGRRSFWRGPWPWVIGGTIVVGTTIALLVSFIPRDDDPQISWEVELR